MKQVNKFISKIKKPKHLIELLKNEKPEAIKGDHYFSCYQLIYRFKNNYGALVFTGGCGLGTWDGSFNKEKPYEICVIKFKNQSHFCLYSPQVAVSTKLSQKGSFGFLRPNEVIDILNKIKKIEKSPSEKNPEHKEKFCKNCGKVFYIKPNGNAENCIECFLG